LKKEFQGGQSVIQLDLDSRHGHGARAKFGFGCGVSYFTFRHGSRICG
jgi:hypothetical protein